LSSQVRIGECAQGKALAEPVARRAGQCERLSRRCGSGRVVIDTGLRRGEKLENIHLVALVTEVTVQLECQGQGRDGGGVLAEKPADIAQVSQGRSLPRVVSRSLGDLSCLLVEGECLVEVAVSAQEPAERGREPHRVDSQTVGTCMVCAGLQVRPFGFQPGQRLFLAIQLRHGGWWASHRGDSGRETLGGEQAGSGCGVQVVVQQSSCRGG
jgi:hypothetical protein